MPMSYQLSDVQRAHPNDAPKLALCQSIANTFFYACLDD
jgi:hypothetical protein